MKIKTTPLLTLIVLVLLIGSLGEVVNLGNPVIKPQTRVLSITGVVEPKLTNDVKSVLNGLTENDTVVVYINSPGGDGRTGSDVMQLFIKTPATVVCKVDKLAASAAAMMLMGCQDKQVANEALIVLHLPYLMETPAGVVRDGIVNEWFTNLMDSDVCLDVFMGSEDYTKLMLGFDILYTGKQFNAKLHSLYFKVNQLMNPLCRNAAI